MKKKLLLACIVVLVLAMPCFAMTIGGTWNTSVTIPEQTLKVMSGDLLLVVAVTGSESDIIQLTTSVTNGVEHFQKYYSSGTGTLRIKQPATGLWVDFLEYKVGPVEKVLAGAPYTPGDTLTLSNEASMAVRNLTITQVADNLIEGKVVLNVKEQEINGFTILSQDITGTVTAIRDSGSSSGCNSGVALLALLAMVPAVIIKRKS